MACLSSTEGKGVRAFRGEYIKTEDVGKGFDKEACRAESCRGSCGSGRAGRRRRRVEDYG